MEKVDINLSVIKGEKLFNENTPFVINIMAPESKKVEKTSHADLICVIDTLLFIKHDAESVKFYLFFCV